MSKKVVLSGYYGFDNFGDDAILSVLCDKLKSLNAQVTVLSNNPASTQKNYNVTAVKNFDIKQVIKTISEADVLFSGGGSLFQDVTSLKSLIYYSLIVSIALFFKKDVVIFAQGVGPLKRKISRFLVKNLFKRAKFVSVRDENSYNLMKIWNIPAKLVNDPVFSVKINEIPKNFAVGVQLRECAGVNDELLENLADYIIKKFPNRRIELFVFQKSYDEAICKQFEGILKSKDKNLNTTFVYYENQAEIYKKIAQLDYMVAMRFHAVIVALKAGVKTAAINYDIKVAKLANSASIPLISMNSKDNDYETIFDNIKSLKSSELSDFSSSKMFDWNDIESLLFRSMK